MAQPNEIHNGPIEYPDGTLYTGEYILDNDRKVRHGQGKMYHARIVAKQPTRDTYVGTWSGDVMEGSGEYSYASGAIYKGEWKANKQHGNGFYRFADGSFYEGQWVEHKMHGRGVYVDVKGRKWTGEFVAGQYRSDAQKALQLKRVKDEKIEAVRAKVDKFMDFFVNSFAGDRKKMAEHAKIIFSDKGVPDVSAYYSAAVIRFAEKKPDIWQANKGAHGTISQKRLRCQYTYR